MKTITGLMFTAVLSLVGGHAMAVEEAEYTVVLESEEFEIRDYGSQIVAEVEITDINFKQAGSAAFSNLFAYISGDNKTNDKIAMTAPVSQSKKGEKIAMTSPVGQTASDDGWLVSFMMPADYTMETIPVPTDPDVTLREIPAFRAATVRYSGRWTEASYLEHLELLNQWIDENGLTVVGEPVWARYDAPLKPWFMRRNEILIPVAQESS